MRDAAQQSGDAAQQSGDAAQQSRHTTVQKRIVASPNCSKKNSRVTQLFKKKNSRVIQLFIKEQSRHPTVHKRTVASPNCSKKNSRVTQLSSRVTRLSTGSRSSNPNCCLSDMWLWSKKEAASRIQEMRHPAVS
ncbi:hypothetical protein JCGZ_15437 [Jatropha curcas]|uniref:Uncharacterized protein n=1 Tax=Jatropha curcas TaxID=180498 RepID=A0A067K5H5_JATCU|nr:hypothetical protein JCGZ_15437 [Jatropha curcas]